MERRTVGVLTAVAVLLSIALTVLPAAVYLTRLDQMGNQITCYIQATEQMEAGADIRQLNLARWYNFCLRRNISQEECREAYCGILYINPGIMGYLELPGKDVDLPVYHNDGIPPECYGAEHVAGSALPVGGVGNHSILTIPGVFAKLEPGDVFSIHILNQKINYRVERVQKLAQGRTEGILPFPKEDRCTLIAVVLRGVEQQKLLIHGIRWEEISLPDGSETEPDLLTTCVMHIIPVLMLPAVTGGIGKTAKWLCRKYSCGTSTNPVR